MPWTMLQQFTDATAVIALIAVFYGWIARHSATPLRQQVTLGLTFGIGAAYMMADPIIAAPGVVVDLRAVPVALAAAYLGPVGGLIAMAIAGLARTAIGGVGLPSGLIGLVLTFLAGLLWRQVAGRGLMPRFAELNILGLGASAGVFGVLALPHDIMVSVMRNFVPFLVPLNLAGVVAVGFVIDRERRLIATEDSLRHDSRRDPLTGVLNRRGFEAAVAGAVQGPHQLTKGRAILMIDIDRFKSVNDEFGHDAGDRVLIEVTARLTKTLRPDDIIARFGGDELAIYLHSPVHPTQVKTIADRLCAAVSTAPCGDGDQQIAVTISIGGTWRTAGMDLQEAKELADQALFAAKRGGRNRVEWGEASTTASAA